MSGDYLDLTDLLDRDISGFEFFQTLPEPVKKELRNRDIRSFRELQEEAGRLKEFYSEFTVNS